ncbi:transcriptional regulator, TetR family [Actinoalloteichus sp. GBA129-24]|uniref:Transcriptional regulator, TetR family n=1 Tax=Actinoalloteichus fjordicus TaxID=1612552 RepID=A0AAC9LEI5_9PSEU|nr:transcriptional regulator, TetR family [Actinoalloteichus fjordicus]APU22547.1 transcriptional regulator, TetR family [Actinoalloteichus sp. GBA129-24]
MLAAAVEVLTASPEAGVEAVAAAAGVTRQTVYAHFPSRRDLLAAALDEVTRTAVAAMDAADLDTGPPTAALFRLIDVAGRLADRHPGLRQADQTAPDAAADRRRHAPVTDRLIRVIRRGQRAGEFDQRLPADWSAAAIISLGHTAGSEVDAGRLDADEASALLRTSLLRLLGATGQPAESPTAPPGGPSSAESASAPLPEPTTEATGPTTPPE